MVNCFLDFRRDPAEFETRAADSAKVRAAGYSGPEDIKIKLLGDITRSKADEIIGLLRSLPFARSITMTVDSNGGEFTASYDIFAALHDHPAESKSAHIVRAQSGALIAALGCDVRTAEDDASILIHPSGQSFRSNETLTSVDLREAARLLEWIDAEICEIFTYRCGVQSEVFKAEQATEAETALSWCVANGIIHKIGAAP